MEGVGIGSGGWIIVIFIVAVIVYLLVSPVVRRVRARRSDNDDE